MRWWKHMNDLLDHPKMHILADKHGTLATDAFIRLMEYAARHFDVEIPGVYTSSFRDFLTKVFPFCSQKKAKDILKSFKILKLMEFEIIDDKRGDTILFKIPEIIELADEYTQKILKDREGKRNEKYRQ